MNEEKIKRENEKCIGRELRKKYFFCYFFGFLFQALIRAKYPDVEILTYPCFILYFGKGNVIKGCFTFELTFFINFFKTPIISLSYFACACSACSTTIDAYANNNWLSISRCIDFFLYPVKLSPSSIVVRNY